MISNTNNKNVFVGTILKCSNVYTYNKYCEEYYAPSFSMGSMECGFTVSTVDIYRENVVLLRTKFGYFVELNDINSLFDVLSINLVKNDDLFVKEDSLIPYFNKEDENNISIRKIKKKVLFDSRIKGG